MSTKTIFKLRKPQNNVKPSIQKESPIIMVFNFGYYELNELGQKTYIPLRYSTKQSIKPCYWNSKPNYRVKQTKEIEYEAINAELDKIESAANSTYLEIKYNGGKPTPDSIKRGIDIELSRDVIQELNSIFTHYLDKFIKNCEDGIRLTEKKTRYSKGSIKNFKGFKSQIELYQEEKNKVLTFDNINVDFYNDLIVFLNKKKYSPNTIGRVIKHMKLIMRSAMEQGYHNNLEYEKKAFRTPTIEVSNIYLNEYELNEMQKLDLSKELHLEKARDVFLIGCYTAQRYSDYSRINKDHIKNGYIHLTQRKTGISVVIPIRPELDNILKKYNYNIPKTHEQKVNKYIKIVGSKAKINEKIIVESIKGGVKIETTELKHDLIKTHTARRSGCTNMFEAGINTIVIMKISGHKTEKEFLKYIKISEKQAAESAAQHPYFSGKKLEPSE